MVEVECWNVGIEMLELWNCHVADEFEWKILAGSHVILDLDLTQDEIIRYTK